MGRPPSDGAFPVDDTFEFPMIPPQVNGATAKGVSLFLSVNDHKFPMIPPQVNGATILCNFRFRKPTCFQ